MCRCAGVRGVAVQRAGHGRRGRHGAAAAVRSVVPVGRNRTARHVRGPGARGHVRYVVAAAQPFVPSSHGVAHHVQVVAVAVAGEGGRWSLKVKTLRQDGGAEAYAVHHPIHGFQGLTFSPEAPGSAPKRAFLKHELTAWIDGPVVAFPRPAQPLGQLDKALVQRKIMPDRVFPALIRSPEEREASLEELVDLTECQPFGGRALDGHNDERDVGVRRLFRSPQARARLLSFNGAGRTFRGGLWAQHGWVQDAGRRAGSQRRRRVQLLLRGLGRHVRSDVQLAQNGEREGEKTRRETSGKKDVS